MLNKGMMQLPLYPYTLNGYAFFLFWVYKVLTRPMTMNIRGGGWVVVLCFLLLHKVSALRMVSRYIHMLILSFHAFICPLLCHSWQGLKPLFPIAYNQATIHHRLGWQSACRHAFVMPKRRKAKAWILSNLIVFNWIVSNRFVGGHGAVKLVYPLFNILYIT